MRHSLHQSRPDSSDPLSNQISEALRFLKRLVALAPEERSAIRIPEDPVAYAEAARLVVAVVEQGHGLGGSGAPRLSPGAAAFAERADMHLEALGITGNLYDLARLAARAILAWYLPAARTAARTVYAPFEDTIPQATLRSSP
jgi:hypothetical protein